MSQWKALSYDELLTFMRESGVDLGTSAYLTEGELSIFAEKLFEHIDIIGDEL